jgi:hypothetical protein
MVGLDTRSVHTYLLRNSFKETKSVSFSFIALVIDIVIDYCFQGEGKSLIIAFFL